MADCGSRIVPPPMVPTSIEGIETEIWRLPFTLRTVNKKPMNTADCDLLVHNCNAVGRFDNLRGILSGGQVDGSNNVGSVGIETT